ncbi:MAG: preprotein translocase subunit YajC [Alphaproteobacteria bacterium]|nr:preprotein translocase subunit YajC [Alphaproteobacteria bacterium]
MFISNAFAQTAETVAQTGAAASPEWMQVLFQFALIFFVLYFLLIRPQQKKFKEHEKALNSIVKGSEVVISGLMGKVTAVEDDKIKVEIAKGVEITAVKAYVSQVISSKE